MGLGTPSVNIDSQSRNSPLRSTSFPSSPSTVKNSIFFPLFSGYIIILFFF